ncbi:class I SAM-dependent methyltransferase [Aeromicrobium sp.]|uniref:class I SAM-dependent methyltransferase n=1 Tax=Aeromicrobium sp. TaxID=1871063 RepID=UPI0030BA7A39
MTEPSYFEDMYAAAPDPWHLAERRYEARKYVLTIDSLPRARYRRAFEPGCSIGLLTSAIAARCDFVLATDAVDTALDEARTRNRGPHVELRVGRVPQDWPDGTFDLIVVSELMYFLSMDDRHEVIRRSVNSLDADGHIVMVHWRHPFDVATCTGDDVHAEMTAFSTLERLVRHEERDFLLEVFGHAGS